MAKSSPRYLHRASRVSTRRLAATPTQAPDQTDRGENQGVLSSNQFRKSWVESGKATIGRVERVERIREKEA
jgi:hypothetical protein